VHPLLMLGQDAHACVDERGGFCGKHQEALSTRTLGDKAHSFVRPVLEGSRHLLAAIDAVLHTFWLDIRAIEPVK